MDWTPTLRQTTLACLILIISLQSAYAAVPCALREVSSKHFVCVCNATYCDTLDADTEVPSGQYVLYTSSKQGLRFSKTTGEITQEEGRKGVTGFTLDPSTKHQTIIGFGGAFTDSAGLNILSLSAPAQEHLLRSYYSPDGIEMTMGRVPIGGTDFSTRPYTYDDVGNDTDLSEFQLQSEDLTYKIPIIKRAIAMSRKSIKLLSAAWSSPSWMKTNNATTGFSLLKIKYYQLWADYHIKFLEAYKAETLDFWAISTGNEPTVGLFPIDLFNSLGWTPQGQSKWVAKYLGPAIKNSTFNAIKILTLDDMRYVLPWWIYIMFNNEETRNYIDGFAVHWYFDDFVPASLLTLTHNIYPEKFLISTEACQDFTQERTSFIKSPALRGTDAEK